MKKIKEIGNRFLSAVMIIMLSVSMLPFQPEYVKAEEVVSENSANWEEDTVSENGTELEADTVTENQNGPENKNGTGTENGDRQDENTQEKSIVVNTVQLFSAESVDYCSIKISFLLLDGVNGYEIYRGVSKADADMRLIKDLSTTPDGSYTDSAGLKTGTKYYYKVRAYALNANNQKVYGGFSNICSARPTVAKPAGVKAESVNYKTLAVSYQEVGGASGYVIYRATKKNGKYKKIATVKDGKTLVYQDKKCKFQTAYYYKVRAYCTVNGKKKYGDYSNVVKGKANLEKPKLKKASVASADTVLLKWNKVSGAAGYVIYRSETKKGTYKKVQTVKNGNTTECRVAGQENGKTYYYQIRAYRKFNGKNRYSEYSNKKKAVFNLLASGDETYQQKARRIFGQDYYKKYSSKEEAEQHMKTIGVYVWDFDLDGNKVTKYRMITVHENIADTVKQIFKEIYEGPEKFPIKNLGGYSWRGDTSNSEHSMGLAIDINWEENYMIDGGVILSGKYWKPGENPYSIPANGDVVRIMKKYGFSWGIWGERRDYMHFSYFGT